MLSQNILLEDDECIQTKMRRLFRSNSYNIKDHHFPLDFVPKLKPKFQVNIPSPMNLGLKCTKLHIKLDKLNFDDAMEYYSDIELYLNKPKKNLDRVVRTTQRFQTNKNLNGLLPESPDAKTDYSKSPIKKVSIRQFKIEELKLDDGEIDFLGTKSISHSPKKTSILDHLERKISTIEDSLYFINK